MSTNDYIPMLIKLAKSNTYVGNSQRKAYSEWKVISGQIELVGGRYAKREYGIEGDFDLVINVNANSLERKIDYSTCFLINQMPTNNLPEGNYEVSKIFPIQNGKIKIGLNSSNNNFLKYLYYADGEEVYGYQLNYDYKMRIGYVLADQDIPFNSNSTIWDRSPLNVNSTSNRLKLISKSKTGLTKTDKRFVRLVFESIDG